MNIPLSLALMQPLRHSGLALGLSLATMVETTVLYLWLRCRVPALRSGETIQALVYSTGAALLMALALLAALPAAAGALTGAFVVRLGALLALIGAGALCYGLALWLFGVPEARALPRMAAARMRPWLLRLWPSPSVQR
ncbi:MAG: hypothetical protein C4289_16715 [Chloroflexota bacterium]